MKTTVSTIALALASMTFGFAQTAAPSTPAPATSKPAVASTAKTTKKHAKKVAKKNSVKTPAAATTPVPAKQ